LKPFSGATVLNVFTVFFATAGLAPAVGRPARHENRFNGFPRIARKRLKPFSGATVLNVFTLFFATAGLAPAER